MLWRILFGILRDANWGPAIAGEALMMVPISLLGLDSSLKDLPLFTPLMDEPPHHTDLFELFFKIPPLDITPFSVDAAPEETPLVDEPAGDGRFAKVDVAEGSTMTFLANGPTWLLVEP